MLFQHIANISQIELITRSNQVVMPDIELSYKAIINKRKKGTPVAYLTGTKEFWSLEFAVTHDTLIPRPETELLVELALEFIDEKSQSSVLDLGTGSGAIAISIANSCPKAIVTGSDFSRKALAVAVKNAENNQVSNVMFYHSDWFEKFDRQQFDVIVSNPPYICAQDPHLDNQAIKHEPLNALIAGEDGLGDLKVLIAQAPQYLTNEGWLLTEHGYDQGDAVALLFKRSGFENIKSVNDLNQIPRVTLGQYKNTILKT